MYVDAKDKFWKRIIFLCGEEWDVEHWKEDFDTCSSTLHYSTEVMHET